MQEYTLTASPEAIALADLAAQALASYRELSPNDQPFFLRCLFSQMSADEKFAVLRAVDGEESGLDPNIHLEVVDAMRVVATDQLATERVKRGSLEERLENRNRKADPGTVAIANLVANLKEAQNKSWQEIATWFLENEPELVGYRSGEKIGPEQIKKVAKQCEKAYDRVIKGKTQSKQPLKKKKI